MVVIHRELDRLRRARGDVAEVLRLNDEIAGYWPEMESHSYAAALRVRLWVAQSWHDPDLLDRAEQCAREALPHFDDGQEIPAITDEWRHVRVLALVRLHIAQQRARGQPDLQPVLDFLVRHRHVHEEGDWGDGAIELLILEALALDAQGEMERALEPLRRALELGEPEGYVRLFVDEGPPMEQLLRRARAGKGDAADYAARLLAAFRAEGAAITATPSPTSAVGLLEPLTAREREVLAHLAAGRSNQEIARALVIAISTVKRHVSNLYGKLGVHSRAQAVARARELGIQ